MGAEEAIEDESQIQSSELRRERMRNSEINHLIAVNVMGWEVGSTKPHNLGEEEGTTFCDYGDNIIFEHEWTPTGKINQAFRVIEKIRKSTTEVRINVGEDIYEVIVYDMLHEDCDVKLHISKEGRLERAICKAALKYKGILKEE